MTENAVNGGLFSLINYIFRLGKQAGLKLGTLRFAMVEKFVLSYFFVFFRCFFVRVKIILTVIIEILAEMWYNVIYKYNVTEIIL